MTDVRAVSFFAQSASSPSEIRIPSIGEASLQVIVLVPGVVHPSPADMLFPGSVNVTAPLETVAVT
jgi:hypothetical protein